MNTRLVDHRGWMTTRIHIEFNPETGDQTMTTETRQTSPYEASASGHPDFAQLHLDRLRLNRASLAAESRLARRLRNKRRGEARHAINLHRAGRIREQSRAAHLAWGYVLGKPYSAMEGSLTRKKVDAITLVAKITLALGYGPNMEDLEAWLPTKDQQDERAKRPGLHRTGEVRPRRTREEWEAMRSAALTPVRVSLDTSPPSKQPGGAEG